jgi:hypothetical protein
VGVRKQETRFLPSAFQLDDKTGEKMGQEAFRGIPNIRGVENLGIAQGKRALDDEPIGV